MATQMVISGEQLGTKILAAIGREDLTGMTTRIIIDCVAGSSQPVLVYYSAVGEQPLLDMDWSAFITRAKTSEVKGEDWSLDFSASELQSLTDSCYTLLMLSKKETPNWERLPDIEKQIWGTLAKDIIQHLARRGAFVAPIRFTE